MRKICLIVLAAALAVPAVAVAVDRSTGDGSLAVSGASGTVYISGSGVIYGHFDQGTLMVLKYKPDDGVSVPSVSSPKTRFARGAAVFTANDVRFLLPSGQYTIELIATDADVSAVGKGSVAASSPAQVDAGTVLPFGTPIYGTVAVNGGKAIALSKGSTSAIFGSTAIVGGK